jgi:hypothetical protein
MVITGTGADATATIVCRFSGTVATEKFTRRSNPGSEPTVGPAFAYDFSFEPHDGGAASVTIPQSKAADNEEVGSVHRVMSDSSTGVTSAQLLFPDASYHVQYRCPDGSGAYRGTANRRGAFGSAFELGFTVAPGNASLSDLILYSDVAPAIDATGYTFPFLLGRGNHARPISSNGSFSISLTAELIASDGSRSSHSVQIVGRINARGDAAGTLNIAQVSTSLAGVWPWEATTGTGALSVPVISPLTHLVSNQGSLLEVADLVYPGGFAYNGYTPSLRGGPPGTALYQPPHIGVTLPADADATVWGRTEDDRDYATLTYAVSADAASVFGWYIEQLSQRGWEGGAKTDLTPSSRVLALEMVKANLDVTVTARAFPTCPPTACASFRAELGLPMVLTVTATGNVAPSPAVGQVGFPPLCPTPITGASIVMKGIFDGSAASTCLGLWTTKTPDKACSGIMQVDYVIDGIPFEISNLAIGQTSVVFAFGSSDLTGSGFIPSLPAASDDQPVHVSAGMLTLYENLYWNSSASPLETVSARVPCQGLWSSG